jgi:hypothetical protein
VALQAHDTFFFGIDRIDGSLVALVQKGSNGLVASFGGHLGGTDDSDGAGVEDVFETHDLSFFCVPFHKRASFGPGRRSRSAEILNVALLRLRFQPRCGLGLNRNLSFVKGHGRNNGGTCRRLKTHNPFKVLNSQSVNSVLFLAVFKFFQG